MPLDLVRSMVSSYADQRIQVISQRVMTTDNLMRIVERYGLYKQELRTEPREAVLETMREDIKFAMISADVVDPRLGRPTKATIAFSVSYDSRSAQLAAKVASELTSLYLRENLETRKQMADDATGFLTTQAERLSKQIAELESTLAAFKEQNLHRLPELARAESAADDARGGGAARDGDAPALARSTGRIPGRAARPAGARIAGLHADRAARDVVVGPREGSCDRSLRAPPRSTLPTIRTSCA